MSAINIADLDHVVVRVADMEKSLSFYENVLGCREVRRVDSIGLVQLRAGDSMLDLVDASKNPPSGSPNMDHFAFRLEDFDAGALSAHLSRHGIDMGEVAQRNGAKGMGPSVYIKDPDGNTVELKGPAAE